MSLWSNRKTSTWSVANFKKHLTSMSCKLEPVIWSCDTGQQIPCFDRCQLIITWMSNIKEVLYRSEETWQGTLDRTRSVSILHTFPFPFCIRSVSGPYTFHIRSVPVPYLFSSRSVLFPFCQCSIGKCSWNSFRGTRFPRTRLQECFQWISNTRLKLSPYVCVHEYKQ